MRKLTDKRVTLLSRQSSLLLANYVTTRITVQGLVSRGVFGWLPRRWISGIPASTLALVLATVLAAVRGELRDLWDPAGEHRLHTHNHPLPSEQSPSLSFLFYSFFFFFNLLFALTFAFQFLYLYICICTCDLYLYFNFRQCSIYIYVYIYRFHSYILYFMIIGFVIF